MKITCKNCSTVFEGNFCSNCGQSADTEKINLHSLWKDSISLIFKYYEKGIIFSVKQLFTRPGHTIREYLEGKRVNHFKPFSLLLMFAALYGVLYSSFNINLFTDVKVSNPGIGNYSFTKVNHWIASNYSLTLFLTLPLFSLGSYLAFNKVGYNLAEHLVLNGFLACQRVIYRVATFPLLVIASSTKHITIIIDFYLIVDFLLMLWSYNQFFAKVKFKKVIVLVVLSYLVFVVGIIFITLLANLILL